MKKSKFQILVNLTKTRNIKSEKELQLLNMFGQVYGLSEEETKSIIEGKKVKIEFPNNQQEKERLLSDMCMLMCIKNEIYIDEYNFCLDMANEMKINNNNNNNNNNIVETEIRTIINNSDHLLNGAFDGKSLDLSFRKIIERMS